MLWNCPKQAASGLSPVPAHTLGKTPVSPETAYMLYHTKENIAVDLLPASYPRGTPGAGQLVKHTVFNSSKARRVLGVDFRKFEDIIKDTEKDLRERGWLVVA